MFEPHYLHGSSGIILAAYCTLTVLPYEYLALYIITKMALLTKLLQN